MSTFPFPILVAGPGPAPEIIDHCLCGIHRAQCTYHATPAPEMKPKMYHVRANGWYTNYVWRTSPKEYTLEEARARAKRLQEINDSGTYTGPNARLGNRLRDMVFEVVQ